MTGRRVAVAAVLAAAAFACTFTRSLAYLTEGVADGGTTPDGTTPAPPGEGGVPTKGDAVAGKQLLPRHLAQDKDNLYWALGDGAVMSAPKAGGEPRKVATGAGGVTALAAEPGAGGDLFVIAGQKAQRVPKAGGDLTVIDGETPPPVALIADDRYLFVIHEDPDTAIGYVIRWDKGGGGRAVLSGEADLPVALALEGASVFWAGSTDEGDLVVFQLPRDAPHDAGGVAQVIKASSGGIDVSSASALAVDAESVYWLDFENGNVLRAARAGGSTPQTLLAAPVNAAFTAIAVDATHVYILDERTGGGIWRVAKTGADPDPFVPNAPIPTSLVVDDRALYFTVQGESAGAEGAVLRVTK